jgi:hypothetical protein
VGTSDNFAPARLVFNSGAARASIGGSFEKSIAGRLPGVMIAIGSEAPAAIAPIAAIPIVGAAALP